MSGSYQLSHTGLLQLQKFVLACSFFFALDGFQLEYAPAPVGNHSAKKRLVFGRVKSPVDRVKSRVPFLFFSFEGYTNGYTCPEKDIGNTSKTQFKGIPTSFPILAAEIQITMPGNALHWQQPKILDVGN